MRQKRLSLLIVPCLFISSFLSAQTDSPQPLTSLPDSPDYSKINTTSYSYEVVPFMFNAKHQFADACYLFFPIMKTELAQNPDLVQISGF